MIATITHPQDRSSRFASDMSVRAAVVRTAIIITVGGAAAFAALTMTACRTTEGAGRDLEQLGDNIADSADKNKP